MGASSVRRWVKHFEDENTSIENEPRSSRPRTASTERNEERVDEIIQDDRRVTVDTIARTLGIGHNAVQEMIESLGYRKVRALWVPRSRSPRRRLPHVGSNCKDGVGSSSTPLL